ncbi:MAG: Alpha/beta hydrolase fold-3 domain protein [Verrucomicrobiales bacterium]|nr:Alpha/beta hydrolase fold-3 domain protein [Verrucomicrobiales bacterium]
MRAPHFALLPFLAGLLLSPVASTLQAETPAPPTAVAAAGDLKDLPYRSGENLDDYQKSRCRLDLYLPPSAKNFPTLVWLHGGALTGGVKDDPTVVAVARHFAASGIAVAAVNYRLSPKAKFPAYLDDTAAAFAWVKNNIAAHGGNPGRVFLGGHSAGGYLALMIGMDSSYLKPYGMDIPAIAGLVPVAGQTLTHYSIREERGLPKDRIFADGASPLHHVRKDAPPMILLYAEKDMALRAQENELLAAALRQAGHTAFTIRMIPGHDHGSVGNDLAKPGDEGFEAILKFVQSVP